MCRLAAFPPGFPRAEAIEILNHFEGNNNDGVGYAFVRDNSFQTYKWPVTLSKILRSKREFLGHMPYNGWTIAHLRAASHGNNTKENTHPFVTNHWAIVHNGVWSSYSAVKLAIEDRTNIIGETDSEVAAHLMELTSPRRFAKGLSDGGVFLALNKNGTLHIAKTSGFLEKYPWRNKTLIASEFQDVYYEKSEKVEDGWFKFNEQGQLKRQEIKKEKSFSFYGRNFSCPFVFTPSSQKVIKLPKHTPDEDTQLEKQIKKTTGFKQAWWMD